jgi:glycosyltransferase involved in cell wall biosynthesis
MSKICAVMIVKNEERVLPRLFKNISGKFSHMVIVDTGSTDSTKELFRKHFRAEKIHGTIVDETWNGFGPARTKAFQIAEQEKVDGINKCDFMMVVDADDHIEGNPEKLDLTESVDYYSVMIYTAGINYWQGRIFNLSKPGWKYVGRAHEFPTRDGQIISGFIDKSTVWIRSQMDGSSWTDGPEKFEKQVALLKMDLEDPEIKNKERTTFYIAQAYRDKKDLEEALKWYEARVNMAGWNDETWYALYQTAILKMQLGREDEAIGTFWRAINMNPTRIEPLYQLIRFYRVKNMFTAGYIVGMNALKIPEPPTGIFIASATYEWSLWDEVSICAFYVNDFETAEILATKALEHAAESEKPRITNNIEFARQRLAIKRTYYTDSKALQPTEQSKIIAETAVVPPRYNQNTKN